MLCRIIGLYLSRDGIGCSLYQFLYSNDHGISHCSLCVYNHFISNLQMQLLFIILLKTALFIHSHIQVIATINAGTLIVLIIGERVQKLGSNDIRGLHLYGEWKNEENILVKCMYNSHLNCALVNYSMCIFEILQCSL